MKTKGYTLIELLVVITIIIILGTLGFVAYGYASASGRDSRRKSDIELIRSALEFYKTDNGYYPDGITSFTNVDTALSTLVSGGYMSSVPSEMKDQINYQYKIVTNDGRPSASPVHYYGYCIEAKLETLTSTVSNCTESLSTGYNYGVKSP